MSRVKERPEWALTLKQLQKWQKTQGVFLLDKGFVEIVLTQYGEPIAIFNQIPYKLEKYSDPSMIMGSFLLNIKEVREAKKNKQPWDSVWINAIYDKFAKCFVYNLKYSEVDYVLKNEDVFRYLEPEERKKVYEKLDLVLEPSLEGVVV